MDDDRRPDPTGRLLDDFVRHVSDQVVVPFTAGRRRATLLRLPPHGERHLVAVVVAAVAVAAAVVLAVLYGPRSTAPGGHSGVTAHPTHATWRVTTGGRWSRVFAPPNVSNFGAPDTITCPPGSISTCYVAANSVSLPAASTSTSAAYRTTDSGTTWRSLTLPAHTWLSSAFSCRGPRTCVVGADEGFDTADTPDFSGRAAVLTTDDGGRRWTVHYLPSAFGLVTDLSCPTPAHCVAFAWLRGSDPLPNPQAGFDRYYPTTVLTTDDGGRRWERSSLPPGAPTVRFELASDAGGSLTCPTATVCDATGDEAQIVTTGGDYVVQGDTSVALVSGDGGRSWKITHRTSLVGPGTLSISCVRSTCRMLADPGPGLTSPYDVLASDDGGRRWSPLAATGLPLPEIGELGSIRCPSVDDCLIPANGPDTTGPSFLATGDGGRHWQTEALPSPPTGEIGRSVAAVSCSTSGSCLALVDDALRTPAFGVADEILTNVPRSDR